MGTLTLINDLLQRNVHTGAGVVVTFYCQHFVRMVRNIHLNSEYPCSSPSFLKQAQPQLCQGYNCLSVTVHIVHAFQLQITKIKLKILQSIHRDSKRI
ncbi:hypothetical protein BaRGS_00020212 [Batillaria attramentaria]|uniref:Uncharacterized protein n=1 Tax=Batillaria attramentaria TaxID=370345 RepID=A0ABD0KMX5_9CAEN